MCDCKSHVVPRYDAMVSPFRLVALIRVPDRIKRAVNWPPWIRRFRAARRKQHPRKVDARKARATASRLPSYKTPLQLPWLRADTSPRSTNTPPARNTGARWKHER